MRWVIALCLLMIALPAAAQDTRDADHYAKIPRSQALAEETRLNRQFLQEIEDEYNDANDRYHRDLAKLHGDEPEKRRKVEAEIQIADEKRQDAVVREQRRHQKVVREIEQFYADQARGEKPSRRPRRPKRS